METLLELFRKIDHEGKLIIRNGLCGERACQNRLFKIKTGNILPSGQEELDDLLMLFWPSGAELEEMKKEGYCTAYWGSDLEEHHKESQTYWSDLRQNILLFGCAMRGEL